MGKSSELLDSEVERFLRSRLVMCRLTDVMTPDIITKYDSESDSEEEDGVEGHGIFNVTATTRGQEDLKSSEDLGRRLRKDEEINSKLT